MADPAPVRHQLVVFTEAECALIVKALGHYNGEYALTSEIPMIERLMGKLT